MSNNQKKIDADNLSRVNGAFKDIILRVFQSEKRAKTVLFL